MKIINASDISGELGFQITFADGQTTSSAGAIAGAGDVNGDGSDDFVFGAPRTFAASGEEPNQGAAVVVLLVIAMRKPAGFVRRAEGPVGRLAMTMGSAEASHAFLGRGGAEPLRRHVQTRLHSR